MREMQQKHEITKHTSAAITFATNRCKIFWSGVIRGMKLHQTYWDKASEHKGQEDHDDSGAMKK